MTFIFIVSFVTAAFGGTVDVEFKTNSLVNCDKLRRVVSRQLDDYGLRHTMTGCEERAK